MMASDEPTSRVIRDIAQWEANRPAVFSAAVAAHIAAGLIWAGPCAALLKRFLAYAAQRVGSGAAISTRRVAMCAHLLLTDLIAALLRRRDLRKAWQEAMEYLLANAGRSNVPRDQRIGRLRSGLVLVGGA